MALKKICSYCKKNIIDANEKACTKCIANHNKNYDKFKRNKKSRGFYKSKEWLDFRAYIFETYGDLDVWHYYKTGKLKKANTLHHIEELKEAWDKRLEPSNVIQVSSESHSEIHRLYKKNKHLVQIELKNMIKGLRNINNNL